MAKYKSDYVVLPSAGLLRFELAVTGTVLYILVPSSVSDAFARFESVSGEDVPLRPGFNRYIFTDPPGRIYLTASGNGTITVMSGSNICPEFFGEGGASSVSSLWQDDLVWPGSFNGHSAAVTVNGGNRNQGGPHQNRAGTASGCIGVPTGAGTQQMEVYREFYCLAMTGSVIVALGDDFPIIMPLGLVDVAHEETRAVYWDRFLVSFTHTGADLDDEVGIQYQPGSSSGLAWFTGNKPGYGIIGDGAGGLRFVSRKVDGAAYDRSTPLVWPKAIPNWVRVDVVHYAATETTAARVEFYLDRQLVVSELWGAGTVLPVYGATLNSVKMWRAFKGGPNGVARLTNLRMRAGLAATV